MRRYLQFRLRTLFIVVTLAALLAWIGPPAIQRYRENQRRLAAEKLAAQRQAALAGQVRAAIAWLGKHTEAGWQQTDFPSPESP